MAINKLSDFTETTPPESPTKGHSIGTYKEVSIPGKDVTFNETTPITIPIKTTKCLRPELPQKSDTYLRYIIDNDVGSYIQVEDNVLKLFSKSGKLLSAINIPTELPDYSKVKNKYLFIDEFGNISWSTGSAGEYFSGISIYVDVDHKVNLLYDPTNLKIDELGRLAIDTNKIQEKLVEGPNIAIEGNKISATDTTYTAGKGITIDEHNKNQINVSDDYKDYYFMDNKPSINGVTLLGNLLGIDLKLDIIQYISYRDYRHIEPKEPKLYFVCKSRKDLENENCWRIYLQNKLIGEWDIDTGSLTLPVFPMRFPFRLS